MLDTLVQQGKQVYVFADTPMNAQLPLRHYYLKQRLGIDMQYVSEHKKAEIARSAEADKTIENIVKQRPAVHWVNIMGPIPADKTIDGLPIYSTPTTSTPTVRQNWPKNLYRTNKILLNNNCSSVPKP